MYNQALENSILSLSSAILNGKDEALCSELLLSLVDNFTPANISTHYKKDNTLIKKAKEMIYCKLENVLRIDEICKEFGMTKFQFIRMFTANTGISPYQYFINCKVGLAKQLLEKNKDIYSAIVECGFVDLSHLNKHFKRIYITLKLKKRFKMEFNTKIVVILRDNLLAWQKLNITAFLMSRIGAT